VIDWIVLLAFLQAAVAVKTSPVTIDLQPWETSVASGPVNVVARPVAGTGRLGEPVAGEGCRVPGTCTVHLTQGTWLIEVDDPAFFALSRAVTIPDGQRVMLQVRQRITVSGEVRAPAFREMTLHFRSAEGPQKLEAQVACPVQEGSFTCRVPVGVWDLRFRARGHASHYVSAVRVRQEPVVLPAFHLAPGASLVGTVDAQLTKSRGPTRASVTLSPSAGGTSATLRTDETGFFQFTAVSPGEYRLRAHLGESMSDSVPVTVVANQEATLIDSLTLDVPKPLRVSVDPAADAAGQAWTVEVESLRGDGRRGESAGAVKTREGRASLAVRRGDYRVRVKDGAGSIWYAGETAVGAEPVDVRVKLSLLRVTGTVRLGADPIPAKLRWIGYGSSIATSANDEGRFATSLPDSGEAGWMVEIDSPLLFVKRTLSDLSLQRNEDGSASIDLVLPRTRVSGRVVDEHERAVDGGFIQFKTERSELIEVDVMPDGEFVLNAAPPGQHTVKAFHRTLQSDAEPVEVSEEQAETRLTLVVRQSREVRGRVFSAAGPVPFARVWATSTDRPPLFVAPSRCDAAGRFTFLAAPGSLEYDFRVEAPGFATRLFHRQVDSDSIAISLDQRGGALRLRLPRFSADPVPQPFLVHNGAHAHAYVFLPRSAWSSDTDSEGEHTVEAGHYALCMIAPGEEMLLRQGRVPAERCATGFLAPFGDLGLDATPLVRKALSSARQ
jgi:hypothetical protein